MAPVFVTGGTGYLGRPLISALLAHGDDVHALLIPAYAILRRVPSTRETAIRLGLVTRRAMVAALLQSVLDPPLTGIRIVGVPEIASSAKASPR